MAACLRKQEVIMSKEIKGDHKHLTLSDRIYIEQALIRGENFRTIAKAVNKDPSTISLEIRKFVEWDDGRLALKPGNDCIRNGSCDKMHMCLRACSNKCRSCFFDHCAHVCPHYEPYLCDELKSPPYVCNGCKVITSCNASQIYYKAEEAHKRYTSLLSESRAGINMTPEQLKELDDFISPLIKQGQPLSHIFSVYGDSIPCSRKTIYNYLDMGIFTVKNIDLPRRVRYKLRKKRRGENPINYAYRNRRTYKDFLKYTETFPDYEVVEMDTVKGSRDAGKCLMTLLFRKSSFMLIFLLPSCTQKSVQDVFDMLYDRLGPVVFRKTFRIILTDNGPEFKDPWAIEMTANRKRRTRVFYCDPYKSN
jgi:IS30 family transposase